MASSIVYPSDIAFTPAVKAVQQRKGSRDNYARLEAGEGWSTTVTPALAAFIAEQDSIYVGTSNAGGQPYIQHRGGPPGFLRVLDATTLAFADFRGNRQYITQGNLVENPQAFLFLMDYTRRRRMKLWGTAQIVEGDASLLQSLTPVNYRAVPEQAFVFKLAAWDANCPQHIPKRIAFAEMNDALNAKDHALATKDQEIAVLTEQVNALNRRLAALGGS